MRQNAPKQHARRISASPISARVKKALLGGVSAAALSMPMMSQDAAAESWTVTRQYYPGGSTTIYRWGPDGDGSVTRLSNPAPGNNCPVPAFEVMNPGRGEARCVGYVVPSWLTR
jgi:hypothetical protein